MKFCKGSIYQNADSFMLRSHPSQVGNIPLKISQDIFVFVHVALKKLEPVCYL